MFDAMIDAIREDTVRIVLSAKFRTDEEVKREQVSKVTATSGGDGTEEKRPVKKTGKVGVNDPCPCGSGKKYKKCCGRPGAKQQ